MLYMYLLLFVAIIIMGYYTENKVRMF